MARVRLHLICGNCGCNDEWEWEHVPKEVDGDVLLTDENIYLWCRNCGTLHSINDNAKKKNSESPTMQKL